MIGEREREGCAVCAYFAAEGDASVCRRFPPTGADGPRWFEGFPRVLADGWCGEFKPFMRRRAARSEF